MLNPSPTEAGCQARDWRLQTLGVSAWFFSSSHAPRRFARRLTLKQDAAHRSRNIQAFDLLHTGNRAHEPARLTIQSAHRLFP